MAAKSADDARKKAAEQATYKANKLKYGARIADAIRAEARITAGMGKNPKPGAKDATYYKGVADKNSKVITTKKAEAKITASMLKKRAAIKAAEAKAAKATGPKAPRGGGGLRGGFGMGSGGGSGRSNVNR
jgi:membrane protein involved in colicin uptake